MYTPGKAWKPPGNMEKILIKFERFPWWLQWILTGVLAVILYMPITGNTFVSDDYFVLKKVCIDHKLNTDGFFRPLSDITLYLNYLAGGFNPIGYCLTNILVHALDTLLLFHFCRLWKWTEDSCKQLIFAGIAALLFLCYPFHSEPVVWILGRACLLANTFGIMALVVMVSDWKEPYKIASVAICYFIAMTAYESVMVLPAMILIWLIFDKASVRRCCIWMFAMALTLLGHFVLRIKASGNVAGEYGGRLLHFSFSDIIARTVKTTGRFLLPPMQHATTLAILFIITTIIVLFLLFRLWKALKNDRQALFFLLALFALLCIASLIPFVFGVSTHTSESDRFLHFPSFFLCGLIAFGLINLLYKKRALYWAVAGILLYQIVCLEITLTNWRKASETVTGLIDNIKKRAPGKKMYIINLPEEIEGAYVFRAGFTDALLLHRLDTTGIIVVNRLKRDTLLLWPEPWTPRRTDKGIFIPPSVYFQQKDPENAILKATDIGTDLFVSGNNIVIYWNKKNWITL